MCAIITINLIAFTSIRRMFSPQVFNPLFSKFISFVTFFTFKGFENQMNVFIMFFEFNRIKC